MTIRLADLARRFYKEAKAGGQAKFLGLKYIGFGRYATKEGKIVAISKEGKLSFVHRREGIDTMARDVEPYTINGSEAEPLPYTEPDRVLPGVNQDPEKEPDDKMKGDWQAGAKQFRGESYEDLLKKDWGTHLDDGVRKHDPLEPWQKSDRTPPEIVKDHKKRQA